MTTLLQGLIQLSGHPLLYALGWTLLHFCWQGTAVALMLGCVLGLLGGRSSQARYGAACLALGLMVALPAATFAHIAFAEYKARTAFLGPDVVLDASITLQAGAADPLPPWPMRIAMALDRSLPWVLLTWFAGVMVFVCRLNFGLLVARRLKTAGTEFPSPALLQLFEALCIRLGIDRAVQLLHSAQVQVPTVIGWLRPVVLLPASCLTGLSPEQIEAVLCHELAHVRRHDYLVSVVQSVIETILFYHPAVWWVSKQVRRERECCCDELAVAAGGDVLAYARALSFLEENRAPFPEFVLGANGGVLKMRIQRILGGHRDAEGSPAAALVALAMVLAVAGSYFAAVSHAQAQPSRTEIASATAPSGVVSVSQEGTARFLASAGAAAPQSVTPQPAPGTAQDAGSISGTIVDPHGALVPRANVTAINTDTGVKTATQSDNTGNYSFSLLPPGPYIVEVEAKGFQRLLQENIQVKTGQTVGLNIKLAVGGASENLTVTGKPLAAAQQNLNDQGKELEKAQQSLAIEEAKLGRPQRVSAGVMQGLAISQPQPVYPDEAKAEHVQGVVVLHARISKQGTIENVQARSGPPLLIVSAVDAVRQWKYKPYTLNGEPTEVDTTINVNYTFDGDAEPPAEPGNGAPASGHSFTPPLLIYKVDPGFSAEARQAKIGGIVLVGFVVNAQGAPESVQVLRGVGHGLDEKAVEAVKQYRFKPATDDGKPVATDLRVEVNFNIMDSPEPKVVTAMAVAAPVAVAPPPPPPVPPQAAINVDRGAPAEFNGVPVRRVGGGVTAPVVVFVSNPEYTKEAKKAGFKGIVLINLIVDTNGMPQNVHVLRSVGMGLDQKAVDAVKQYRFKPAMEGGKPVPVELNVEVNFQIF
jgi:TonB family protein